jgi:hypothetical protein
MRDGFVRVEFTECHGFDQNMWLDVSGGCEAVLEAAGAKSVRLHIESGGAGEAATCSAVAWWTDETANPPPSSIPPPSVAAR